MRDLHTPCQADPSLIYPSPDTNPILSPTIQELCGAPGENDAIADPDRFKTDVHLDILPKLDVFYAWVLSRLGWLHHAP